MELPTTAVREDIVLCTDGALGAPGEPVLSRFAQTTAMRSRVAENVKAAVGGIYGIQPALFFLVFLVGV